MVLAAIELIWLKEKYAIVTNQGQVRHEQQMASLSSQRRQEICVAGWIRENRGDRIIPDELLYIIVLMYVLRKDKWEKERCDDKIKITKDGLKVQVISNDVGWSNAFGKLEIKKGEINVWRFRVNRVRRTILNQPCLNSDEIWVIIGIVQRDSAKLSNGSKLRAHQMCFVSHGKVAYALHTWNGKKYHVNKKSGQAQGFDYTSPIRDEDIVEMHLDMTESETKGLSFKINGVDQGTAFDDFDMDKTYCMAVAFYQNFDSVEIID